MFDCSLFDQRGYVSYGFCNTVSAMFPLIHFTDNRESLNKRLSDEDVLGNEYLLYQGNFIFNCFHKN